MVALGKAAAAARAGTGTETRTEGVDDGEARRRSARLRDDPFLVGEPADDPSNPRDSSSSPSLSCGSRTGLIQEESGGSHAPPPGCSWQDHRRHEHQRRQPYQRYARQRGRSITKKVPPSPRRKQEREREREREEEEEEEEETGSVVEGDPPTGDYFSPALLRRPSSSPRKSEPENFAEDRAGSAGSRRDVCAAANFYGDADADGDDDGDDVGVGDSVLSSVEGQDGNGICRPEGVIEERSAIGCSSENEPPGSVVAEGEPKGPLPPPPRCSLFDLADQSIDEI